MKAAVREMCGRFVKPLLVGVLVLALLAMASVALAQDDVTPLPTDLSDLLTPAGLGVVVVIIVGLLKRAGTVGKWIKEDGLHAFAVSLGVAAIILGIVHIIQYFGVYDLAQGFWANFCVAWAVSQAAYNIQKVSIEGIVERLDS